MYAKSKFEEFLHKFKYLSGVSHDKEAAELLNIKAGTFSTMKINDDLPIEQTIKYCEERSIDIDWIMNLNK